MSLSNRAHARFPHLSKAVKYFKETERGLGKMCKTVEDYAKNYAEEREKSFEKKDVRRECPDSTKGAKDKT